MKRQSKSRRNRKGEGSLADGNGGTNGNLTQSSFTKDTKEAVKMLQKHEQVAEGILNGGIVIKAKDEAEAIKKMNKALKNPEGYGFKIYKSKGYYGKYELVMTFKGKKGGSSYAEFNIEEKEDGLFGIGEPYGGYNAID